jgi:hypothetical protein
MRTSCVQTWSRKSKMAATRPGKTWNSYISLYAWDKSETKNAISTFGSSDPQELLWILCSQTGSGKSKMAATKWKWLKTYIILTIDRNSMTMNIFSRSSDHKIIRRIWYRWTGRRRLRDLKKHVSRLIICETKFRRLHLLGPAIYFENRIAKSDVESHWYYIHS